MGKELFGYEGSKPTILLIALLALVQGAAVIGQALGLAQAISALFAGQAVSDITGPLLLFVGAFIVRQLSVRFQQTIAGRFAEATSISLRKKLLKRLFELGPRFTGKHGAGNLVTLALEGAAQFRTYLELIVPRGVGTAVIPVMVLGFVLMQDVVAGVILIVTMPILIGFMILLGLAARKQMDKQWKSYRILANHFTDSLRGLETLRFLGRSRSHGTTIEQVSTKYRSATMRTLRVAFLSSFALDFFTMLSVASVAVSLGLRLVNGGIGLEAALLVLILAPEYFLPVRMVGSDYHATLNGKEAGLAIQSIIDEAATATVTGTAAAKSEPQELQESQETQELPASITNWSVDDPIGLCSIQVNGEAESRPLVRDVTAQLKGARKIGIVGESGAGKSTLIDVIGGFIAPSTGGVSINGSILGPSNKAAWQRKIAYIPQHPHLFSLSLADNVRFYEPEASQQEVEAAIRAAGLWELAQSLPNGCDEMIGDGGRTLSGGQAQRVALARAFLGSRPLVLLDEPTSHLDIETELELKRTMLDLFADRRIVLATHRLHWMPEMDHILVMHEGNLAEWGTHEQLLAQRGIYYELFAAQAKGVRIGCE
ncbi:thiol reductant ABC exporter subunit CydD [Paenibacillus eucommiae]|uniref:ATP-binding cassette subfamily C protein CydD n=1 Tax=Paenibacillus eucommiae TaxID=1355755 RepID=A0ABS4IWS7_9BACL|nr:thiol reductant ABC exporter subunit CydD [Paenibacillus eucommiae]MBP1990989.1 ATP-binding cassette subfamily C protein CydD [Paenibacillus eucommiae]